MSDKSTHVRIVLEWGAPVTYDLNENGTDVSLAFNKAATPDFSISGESERVRSIAVIQRDPFKVNVSLHAKPKEVRHFSLGQKIVVDIFGEMKASPAIPTQDTASQKPIAQPLVKPHLKKSEKPIAKEPIAKKAEKKNAPPAVAVAPVEVEPLGEQASDPLQVTQSDLEKISGAFEKPHILQIASIKKIGLAAFRKNNTLYIATTNKESIALPGVQGPNPDRFHQLFQDKDTSKDITMYGYRVPVLYNVDINGGGLAWDVVLTQKNDVSPEESLVPIKQNVQDDGSLRGGSVLFPLKDIRMIASYPIKGHDLPISVVTVGESQPALKTALSYIDFDVYPSPAGLAIEPKVDDLTVEKTKMGVVISRPDGLALAPDKRVTQSLINQTLAPNDDSFFKFADWQMGTIDDVQNNHVILLSGLPDDLKKQAETFLTLGKMYLSHGLWAESLGLLRMVKEAEPSFENNGEYLALEGMAYALSGNAEDSFKILSQAIKRTKPNGHNEINFWRAKTLADLGDWQQAAQVMPEDFQVIASYPAPIAVPLALHLAEIALRMGNKKRADQLMGVIARYKDTLTTAQNAGYKYLQGEAARQAGDVDDAIEIWERLADGGDDLYHVKSGLALSRLALDKKKIKPDEAINRLEALRYAWRGDELETQVNLWLGQTYIDANQFTKGLHTLREGASLDSSEYLRPRMTDIMGDTFETVFTTDAFEKLSPIDAMSLYEQFPELLPADKTGDAIGQKLASKLSDAGLYGRAAGILQKQVDYRLKGVAQYETARKLANLHLLTGNVDEAIRALNIAEKAYILTESDFKSEAKRNDLSMIRAETMAQNGQVSEALTVLEQAGTAPELNRKRAQIAWRAKAWDDAAVALNDVIIDRNISLNEPFSADDTALIAQYAVALNLSGDRIGLATARQMYGDGMAVTDKAKVFDIVTRPRGYAGLADRETLIKTVNEVDLFKGIVQ